MTTARLFLVHSKVFNSIDGAAAYLAGAGGEIFSFETRSFHARPLINKNFDSSLYGLIRLHDEWKGNAASFGRSLACFGTGFYDLEVREMGYPVE
jgi:hypothetical protein